VKRSRLPRPLRRGIAFAILFLAIGLAAKLYQRWGTDAGISAGAESLRAKNSACLQGCAEHFLDGQAPRLVNPKLAGTEDDTLCFDGYGVYHSGRSRTPLWSAEHLTRTRLAAARQLRRENLFHEEERLPEGHRASLKDYAHSGYDRGHMEYPAVFILKAMHTHILMSMHT